MKLRAASSLSVFSSSHISTSFVSRHGIGRAASRVSPKYCYRSTSVPSQAQFLSTSFALISPRTFCTMPIMGLKAKDKSSTLEALDQKMNETPLEAQARHDANFAEVESQLPVRFSRTEMGLIDRGTATLLGSRNPFSKRANPKDNVVWLLDNTAYRPVRSEGDAPQPWEAEFVACFFHKGRKNISKHVSVIADLIGLDGKAGGNEAARKRIEERLMPFIIAISPARTLEIKIPSPSANGTPHRRVLGPSNVNGISSQILPTGGANDADGKTVSCTSEGDVFPDLKCFTHFASPEGWGVISDIDDTIKVTMTSTPTGILQSTFADIPKTTLGMPEFYKVLHESLNNPAWFYLSASPYNLYPFLHQFLGEHYPQGTMILRDASWMSFAGVLQSLTKGVEEYKTNRMEKIHTWLPRRHFICIGDSTQSDPESYAAMYTKYPDWIKAIYIRKVTDAPNMEMKNKPQRFRDAFKNVPDSMWRVFVDPKELVDHFKHVAGVAHAGVLGNMLSM